MLNFYVEEGLGLVLGLTGAINSEFRIRINFNVGQGLGLGLSLG